MSEFIRIIYSSRPFGFDEGMLNGILVDARRCNTRDDVTGALVCRQDIYLQQLEGPRDVVQATYERIRRDDRHLEVVLRVSEDVSSRMFGDWAMFHDPAKSWIWSADEISDGVLERATEVEFKEIFERLAADAKTS